MNAFLPGFFIFLSAMSLVLVLLWLWQSLRAVLGGAGGTTQASAVGVAERDSLLAEKNELLTAIRDIRFEHDLGKISDGDYQRMDKRYRARAREVLRELDAQVAPYRDEAVKLLGGESAGASAPADEPSEEQPTATRTRTTSRAESGASEEPSGEAAEESEAKRAEEVTALKCAGCGTLNDSDAKFCKNCAAGLRGEE